MKLLTLFLFGQKSLFRPLMKGKNGFAKFFRFLKKIFVKFALLISRLLRGHGVQVGNVLRDTNNGNFGIFLKKRTN